MKHEMKLKNSPFSLMKSGSKCVELRLYDEKRRLLKVGDSICFTNVQSAEQLEAKIIDLRQYTDFFQLYKNFSPVEMGYREGEVANPEDMYAYYAKEDIEKYGVLAIYIKRI